MPAPVLATKLFIPPPRPKVVFRPRLIERLNEGLHRKLILISAPAGFGKTTLVGDWIAGCERLEPKVRIAWLSLDEGDGDLTRFLTYLVAALQTIAATIGEGVVVGLQSQQPPPAEAILTALLNEMAVLPGQFLLVLDDYHVIDSPPVDQAVAFLLEHLPPRMHLVMATREDPQLPLARYRARDQLTELRAADLRFTPAEAADFLNLVMGLDLSAEDTAALEERTEGWIAGLQFAALALQGLDQQGMAWQAQAEPGRLPRSGRTDAAGFIRSFSGSHHFVLDYLLEEVLHQQPESLQAFLLRTSILDRLCGPLCEAVLGTPAGSGQEALEALEHANLFTIPLDNDRQWYRYHHLFADLLRQRLGQSASSSASGDGEGLAELHIRASDWYEGHGLGLEAFHHAAAARDVERAERLIEGGGMPLHFRGVVTEILDWLGSLPSAVLEARPALRVRFATLSLIAGQTAGVEENLQAAEAILQGAELDARTRDLVGQIATARATLALTHYRVDAMIAQAQRALTYLHPENRPFRTSAIWILGVAHQIQGDRAAAGRAFAEILAAGPAPRDSLSSVLATIGLGEIQESGNQLNAAAATYQQALQLAGDPPQPNACEAHLGLARICYEWNDLAAAQEHGQQSLHLARQYDRAIDRFLISEVFLARLRLAQGDETGAAAILAQAEQSARQQNFVHRLPEIAAQQLQQLLHQGQLVDAAQLAQAYDLPFYQALVHLAQGDACAALALLEPLRRQAEAKDWQDKRLKVLVLQAVAHHIHGEKDQAVQVLGEALALAAPGGFIRTFVDEGEPMRWLILDFRLRIEKQSRRQDDQLLRYVDSLLASFSREPAMPQSTISHQKSTMIEPLSQRELEVLRLIAQGLSNRAISERLFLALNTVKGHNRIIFDKLQVQSRTEAVARARELGLL